MTDFFGHRFRKSISRFCPDQIGKCCNGPGRDTVVSADRQFLICPSAGGLRLSNRSPGFAAHVPDVKTFILVPPIVADSHMTDADASCSNPDEVPSPCRKAGWTERGWSGRVGCRRRDRDRSGAVGGWANGPVTATGGTKALNRVELPAGSTHVRGNQ